MMIVKKFLLSCSGANSSVLAKINSPLEEDKFVAQGTSVVVTSSMATLSGGYALYAVFGTGLLAVPFGLFWGGSILLLDRLLLITMRKRRDKPLAQFAIAAPRLVLALFIGFTVSKPLELRMFKTEIQTEARASLINTVNQELASLNKAKQRAEVEAKEALATANQLYASVIPAKRASARTYRQMAAQKTREAAKLDNQIAEKMKVLSAREKVNAQDIRLGLLRQIVLLENLAKTEPAVRYTGWMLSLLFVMFEILPILGKLMGKYSVYDAALENLETTGIRLHDKLREVSVEQIDRESLIVRQYREAIAVMMRDEMIRASQQQVINIVRDVDRAPGMAVRQAEITEAVTDRMVAEIKNAVDMPINSHQHTAASGWDFSALRRKLENLFWHQVD